METHGHRIQQTLKDRIREKIWANVEQSSGIKLKRVSWYIGIGRAAAAVIFVILSFHFIRERYSTDDSPKNADNTSVMADISNRGKIIQRVSLVDGTFVHLSPGSTLSFAKKFDNEREVYLNGEAFFEVKKDSLRPFVVYSGEITTRVLGTSFRIKEDGNANEIIVAVKTGKVSVLPSENSAIGRKASQVTLIPNQQLIYNREDKTMHKTLVDEPKIITEKTVHESHYTNAPVVEILNALERDYGINVKYSEESLGNCTLTSDMSEEGFYDRINIICNAIAAKYEIQGTTVVITGDGCK